MNYRITIIVKDVAEGDATDLAQRIYDEHGEELDAPLGDFTVTVAQIDGSFAAEVDWEPAT